MSSGYVRQAGDCVSCGVSSGALRSEVEVLKRRLLDRDVAIVQLEAQMAQDRPSHYPQGQVAVLRAQCDHWQDKYDRLLEAHKRLQKVNQGLEDKLLRLVDRTESEKSSLAADTASLTTALTTAAQAINRLKQENDRYKNDLNLAIQLLQCNPSKYAAHKLDMLPSDLQKKAKTRLTRGEMRDPPRPEMKVIKVPIPTFPPTAMVYSVNKVQEEAVKEEPVDAVSAAIMAAVLEERERERAGRHCPTCTCTSLHSRMPEDGDSTGHSLSLGQLEDRLRGQDRPRGQDPREEGAPEGRGGGEGLGESKSWGDIYKGFSSVGLTESKAQNRDGWNSLGLGGDGRQGIEGRDGWKILGSGGDGRPGKEVKDGWKEYGTIGGGDHIDKFRVNVVDVGTQVLPSYIGETGKVQSTCIYCHSAKTPSSERLHPPAGNSSILPTHMRSRSQPVGIGQAGEGEGVRQEGKMVLPGQFEEKQENLMKTTNLGSPNLKSPSIFGNHASWDWPVGGGGRVGGGGSDDSPSTPSSTTPSSLVSASLSYESETSNGTSPQDSPLRPQLSAPRSNQVHSRCPPTPHNHHHLNTSRKDADAHSLTGGLQNHMPEGVGQRTDISRQALDSHTPAISIHKLKNNINNNDDECMENSLIIDRDMDTESQSLLADHLKQTTDFNIRTQSIDTCRISTNPQKDNSLGIKNHLKTSHSSRLNGSTTNITVVSGQSRHQSLPTTSSSLVGTTPQAASTPSHHTQNSHTTHHHHHTNSHHSVKHHPNNHSVQFKGSSEMNGCVYHHRLHHQPLTPPIHRPSPSSSFSSSSSSSSFSSNLLPQKEVCGRNWWPEAVVASSTTTASTTETTL